MNLSRVEPLFSTVHLIYHRNKNQHGGTAWWKWLSILRRCLIKLIAAAGNEKKQVNVSRYLHTRVISRAYIAFSTVVADGQFSTLGTVLLAALAQTKRVIMPLPKRIRPEPGVRAQKETAKLTDDVESDFGVPIRRAVKETNEMLPSAPSFREKKSIKQSSDDAQKVEMSPLAKNVTKVKKKSTSKKKKSANAIDDIFGTLK